MMGKHEVWCKKSDRTGTYRTKEFEDGEYWMFTQAPSWIYNRCSNCRAVLEVEELGHWLDGKKDKE
jgi:hypothetical protein